ncbi:MAG: ABC transporter ATP-binding protein [Clostridiales bacterium]
MYSNKARFYIFKKIWPNIKNFYIEWILLFIFKTIQIVPILLYPLVFKLFIDQVIEEHNLKFIYKIILFYLGIYFFETLLKIVHRYIDNYLFNGVSLKIRTIMWEKYSYMPITKFRNYNISDLKNRINIDVDLMKSFIILQIFDYVNYVAIFIGSAWILYVLDWRIALLCYILFPISFFISHCYQKKVGVLYETGRKINDQIEQWLQRSFSNWKEIKANNFENWHNKKFSNYLNVQYKNSKSIDIMLLKRNILLNLKDSLLNKLLIYIIGGILHFNKAIVVSIVIVSVQYYDKMLNALTNILRLDMELENLKPSINRVIEILSMNDSKKIYGDLHSIDFSVNTIFKIKHLNYSYKDNSNEILHDISFNIKKGDKIVFFGKSGGGKSTLIKILSGDILPAKNKVWFYGIDIAILNHQLLYKKLTVVFQEPYFMNLSIRDYLLMANQNSTQSDIEIVCSKVNILDFIFQLKKGFDTKIGEQGIRLSGGQKQRLAIARLLLKDSDIIILDELFSEIDGIDKINILKYLFEHFKDKTIICVSHEKEVAEHFSKKFLLKNDIVNVENYSNKIDLCKNYWSVE